MQETKSSDEIKCLRATVNAPEHRVRAAEAAAEPIADTRAIFEAKGWA